MKNNITAHIHFSFKGEVHQPSAVLDLDELMEKFQGLPNLHLEIARVSGIDTFSYLYEAMEMHPITFSDGRGLAVQCLQDGMFDFKAFEGLWHEQQVMEVLAPIALQYLGIEDLNEIPAVRDALQEAYRHGRSARPDQGL